jgi:predicted nucleic acid-binding protein
VVLLDERRGRQAARDHRVVVSGTLRVLDLPSRRRLVRLADVVDRLKTTNFRASPRDLKHFVGPATPNTGCRHGA